MRIPSACIVGLGYVGLTTAACLASRKIRVVGIDLDENRVNRIRDGAPVLTEKGLQPILKRALGSGHLKIMTDFSEVPRSEVTFITVGTPSREDGGIDTGYVEAAAHEIGRRLASASGYHLVVVKSTVTPGTTEGVVGPILGRESRRSLGRRIGLASNPEFLHEGSAVSETFHPEAVVIGGCDRNSSRALMRFYDYFYRRRPTTILTTPSNAEMMKYAINAGRAVQLSFVNTIANLCTRVPGCDYDEVRKGISLVARMDDRYLGAGMGFGGSCLPKDTLALASMLRQKGVGDELIGTALDVNNGQVFEVIRMAERLCGSLEGRRVSVLGLAFKAGTDDIRGSVSIALVRALIKIGADISVFDPAAMGNAKNLFGSQVVYANAAKECLHNSECAILATGWSGFRRLKPKDFKSLMARPVVIDGRRIYDQGRYLKAGVRIATIGTGPRPETPREEKRRVLHAPKEWHYSFNGANPGTT